MSKNIMKEMELKKTITQLLISVSIFSLVVSWCSPTLLHNQNLHYYFSCDSFHLISFTMNKNCIFLICNAILVVVANTSPFHLPPPASDLDDMLQKRIDGGGGQLPLQTESEVLLLSDKYIMSDQSSLSSEDEDDDDDEAEEREVDCQEILMEHCNESGDEVLISIEDADHQNERQDCWLLDTVDDLDHREDEDEDEDEEEDEDEDEDEEEEEEEEKEEEKEEDGDGDGDGDEIEKLSSEELNQKFEDFIRRMKEEFRVNEFEKQQLVLVK